MSNKVVRTHSHTSNRAKPHNPAERKVVFKSVLDSPFRIQWPSVPINLQNSILALIIGMLDGVADYHSIRSKERRKRKHEEQQESKKKKRRMNGGETSETSLMVLDNPAPDVAGGISTEDATLAPRPPTILSHVVVGINEVTKRLESQIRNLRPTVHLSTAEGHTERAAQPPLKFVFVCRADVDPPILIDHLPHLIASYNSSQPPEIAKLIPLPLGAEAALAQATGLRRASVIGIDVNYTELPNFSNLFDSIPALTAPWLSNIGRHKSLVPTHIKQLRTSAPKDMKAAKEQRSQGKAAAKQRQKAVRSPRQDTG